MDDDPPLPTAADYRARAEHARATAQSRYHTELTEVLRGRGVADADVVAEAAIAALFDWRDINSGERCRCRCHPQLPETDLHDYGASCQCTRTDEEHRASFRQALNDIREYWESPDSKRLQAANHEAEEALQTWLAQHPGVVVHGHGGWAPEQWTGQVDGHSFYFRERGGDWHLELDLQPTGHIEAIHGRNDDGTPQYRPQPLEQGDIIATGTTYTDGYGNTPTERAQFIVTTIHDHLTRQTCTHHIDQLDAITRIVGTPTRWCPTCGTHLHAS